GLEKILLDIDQAIKIVRETKEEADVVPNLMIGFGIDDVQAEYVAEIKLRHLNREYILKRTQEISELKAEIEELESILGNDKKVKNIIVSELKEVIKKHGKPRKSLLIYKEDVKQYDEEEHKKAEEYAVHLFFTKEGYFKKITPQSYRMSSEQYLKDGDAVQDHLETTSGINLLFFSDRGQVYKTNASEFADTKASTLGDFVPVKLGMDEGEAAKFMVATSDYKGFLLFFFENGKVAKISLKAYATKTNRKKLINAYNTKAGSPLVTVLALTEEQEVKISANGGRVLIFHTGSLLEKTSKDSQGVQVMTLKKGDVVESARIYEAGSMENEHRYKAKSLPSRGNIPPVVQMTLEDMEE
ncbi:MAG: topoisomerase IV, partial [Oscillospiraceae bacterium]|nr:topoisomerase IV [Oscillospiraceae bacterium]